MVVKIIFSPDFERGFECDHYDVDRDGGFLMSLYQGDKLVEQFDFKSPVSIFIMEKGKTIDRLDFNPN